MVQDDKELLSILGTEHKSLVDNLISVMLAYNPMRYDTFESKLEENEHYFCCKESLVMLT
jgi:hypothetical protein